MTTNTNTDTRVMQMVKVQSEGLELFKKKNSDYGDAFASYGVIGVLVRMGDKILRAQSITNSSISLVNSETLRDTLIDLHNYSAMAIMLLDEDDLKKMTQQLDILMQYQDQDQDLDATTRQATTPK